MSIKKTPSPVFCSGDYVVYPTHGVGKVSDISKQNIAGTELELLVVNFDKDKMTLRIPMAKVEHVGLRKISEESTINDGIILWKESLLLLGGTLLNWRLVLLLVLLLL